MAFRACIAGVYGGSAMGNSILLFLSTYIAVFALGFQSLNVNNGHEKTAFVTSMVISAMNLAILKYTPNASPVEMVGYMLGGPLGIVSSMRVHRWIFGKRQKMVAARNVEAGLPD